MGVLTDETNTLKIYTSLDDEIWTIAGNGLPKPSSYSYDEFCLKPKFINKNSTVRLVGNSRHAKLATKLYLAAQAGEIKNIQVCSPQVERVDLDEYSPEKVLMNMRRWDYPSSLGGFHNVSAADFCVYTMSSMFLDIKTFKQNLDKLHVLYNEHPLSKALSFIPFLNKDMCIAVLSATLDPRWFVDLSSPNKLSKYFEYMGVGKIKNLSDSVDVIGYSSPLSKIERRNAVVNSWQLPEAVNTFKAVEGASAGNFLLDTYTKVGKAFTNKKIKANPSSVPSDTIFDEADLATCQKFLSYIHGMWMNWLYPMPNPWQEPLFVPEHFFTSEKEILRFKQFFTQ